MNKEQEKKDGENKQMENKKKKNRETNGIFSFKSNTFRNGGYSAISIAVMVAIVIIVNLIVSKVPIKYTQYDMSNNKMYTMSDTAKKIVKGLKKDVTIYYLVSDSKKESDVSITGVTKLLEQYESASSHVDMQIKNPELYPDFGQKYDASTDTILIVECDKRYKTINYSDIYTLTNEEEVYTYGASADYQFNGDGMIANAINYVTNAKLPSMYCLTGEGEQELDEELKSNLVAANMVVEDLNLVNEASIPENCDCLLINAPEYDINANATKAILEYLKNGGKTFIAVNNMSNKDMPNLASVLKEYGVEVQDGMVIERDAGYINSNLPNYCAPEFCDTEITEKFVAQNVRGLFDNVQSIKEIEGKRDTISVEPIMKTSSQAVLSNTSNDSEKTVSGPFNLAVMITDTNENMEETDSEDADSSGATNAQLVVFGTDAITDPSLYQNRITTINAYLFLETIGCMCDYEDGVEIASKSMSDVSILITDKNIEFWLFVYMSIPVILIAGGMTVVIRRRRR